MNNDKTRPTESGAQGAQSAAQPEDGLIAVRGSSGGGIQAYPVSAAIVELSESGPRSLGNTGSLHLMAAYTQHVTLENIALRRELAESRTKISELGDQLGRERVDASSIRERLKAELATRPLRSASIALGAAMAIWGIEGLAGGNLKVGLGTAIFGAVFLLLGWLTGSKQGDKT